MPGGRIQLKAQAALYFKDALLDTPVDTSALRLCLPPGGKAQAKPGGCYVLLNCPRERFRVGVESPLYEAEELFVDLAAAGGPSGGLCVRTVFLARGQALALPAGAASAEGRGVPGSRVLAFPDDAGQALRLLADAKKGDAEIRLYHPQSRALEGRSLYLRGKSGGELHTVVRQAADGCCVLDRPLQAAYGKVGGSAFVVQEGRCGADGRFRIAFGRVPADGCACVFLEDGREGSRLKLLPQARSFRD